jgi:Na+-driven multidrug efflux pump
VHISYPVFIQSFFIHLGFYVFLLINDQISVQAVAASNIALTIMCISFLPGFGFGIAAATLIGQKLGERKPDEAECYGWFSLGPGIIIMGLSGMLFVLFGSSLMRFYIGDPEVIALGARVLFLIGGVLVFDAFGVILSRGLQGAGLTRYVMIAEIIVNWFIFLPLAYFLGVVMGWGVSGAWSGMIAYVLVFAFLMFRKFVKGDWKSYHIEAPSHSED